jgi:antitoxin (DNA-binding transcriptional repressor) of toxin-antitoxin stability system
MAAISLLDARADLRELIDRVDAGVAIAIARRAKPVAQIAAVASTRARIDAARLASLRSTMPQQTEGAADLVRSMRYGDRF